MAQIIQDELPQIVRSLRFPAGDDPRFSTPESILSHRADFVPLVYATWKNIYNRAVDELVKIESILRSPYSKDLDEGLTRFLRRSQMIWRRISDALVRSVLGLDKGHVVRLLCHWKRPRPVLAEANLASM